MIPVTVMGDDVWWRLDMFFFRPSPISRAEYPLNVQHDMYQGSELTMYHARLSDLDDPGRSSIPATVTFTRINQWEPFMEMGNRPGHMVFHAAGKKLEGGAGELASLNPHLNRYLTDVHPEYLRAPAQWQPGNVSQWDAFEALNYEAGYKLVTRNGRHRFNAAAFLFEWTNQQFTQATPFDTDGDGEINPDLVDYQTVAGESEIKGAEFFYSGWLGKYINVSATYNYNDAKYVVFEDATHGRVYGSRDASGKTMPRSPKSSATLGLGFLAPISSAWDFNARADDVYRGSSYTWAVNLAETCATNRLSLRAGIRSDRFDISVWMNNVTDDDTLMAIRRFSALENFVSPTWWAGLPGVREAGITFRVTFF